MARTLFASLLCAGVAAGDDRVDAIFRKYDADSDGKLALGELQIFHKETSQASDRELDAAAYKDLLVVLDAPSDGLPSIGLSRLYRMNGRLDTDYTQLFPGRKAEEQSEEDKSRFSKEELDAKMDPDFQCPEQEKIEIKVPSEEAKEFLELIREAAGRAALAGPEKEEELEVMLGAAAEATGIEMELLQKMVAVEKRKAIRAREQASEGETASDQPAQESG